MILTDGKHLETKTHTLHSSNGWRGYLGYDGEQFLSSIFMFLSAHDMSMKDHHNSEEVKCIPCKMPTLMNDSPVSISPWLRSTSIRLKQKCSLKTMQRSYAVEVKVEETNVSLTNVNFMHLSKRYIV